MPDVIPPPFTNSAATYTRSGACNRCGDCCIVDKCPHIKKVQGKWTCLIYATRDQECESCKVLLGKVGKSYTHAQCQKFPDHPFLDCLKTGKCGYLFTPGPVEV